MRSNRENSAKSFVGMVVIPILVMTTLVGVSLRWRQAGHVSGFTFNQCQGYNIRKGNTPADVLLVGSSRMGLAIDDVAVEKWWPSHNVNVESLMIIGSSEIQQMHGLHEYIRTRGVPETVGIEVSIDKGELTDEPAWSQYKSSPWIKSVPSFSTLFDVFNTLRRDNSVSWADVLVSSHVSNPLAVMMSGFQVGIDQSIRNPRQIINPFLDCEEDYFKMFREDWAEPMPDDYALPTEAKMQMIRESADRVTDADIDSTRAIGEFALLNNMVTYAKKMGVKNVFVMYYPDFDENPEVMPADKIIERVPDVPLFDLRDEFKNGDPRTKYQYLDWRHMNSYGGWEISKALSMFIQNLGSNE